MGHLGLPLPRRAGRPGGRPSPRGKPRVLLHGVDVPAVPRDDVHAGRGEAALPDHGDVRQRPRGGELRHLARLAVRPGRDDDRFRARSDRDRQGGVPLLPFALGCRGGDLEGRPVSRRGGGRGRPQRVDPLRSAPSPGKPDRPPETRRAEGRQALRRAGAPHGPDHRRLRRRRPQHGRPARADREGVPARSGDRRLLRGVPRGLFREGAVQGGSLPAVRFPSCSSSSRISPS